MRTMSFKHDVDICVTCITDKPPNLPLREELVSQGVEVILNARGVGAKAVKHEVRQQIRALRKEHVMAEQSTGLCCFSWKSQKQKLKEENERKRIESELRKELHALTYEKYSLELNQDDHSYADSVSTWGTHSTCRGSVDSNLEQRDPANDEYHLDETVMNAFAVSPEEQRRRKETERLQLDDSVANAFADSSAAEGMQAKNNSNATQTGAVALSAFDAYSFLSSHTSTNENTQKSSMSQSLYSISDSVPLAELTDDDSSSGDSDSMVQETQGTSVSDKSRFEGDSFTSAQSPGGHAQNGGFQHNHLFTCAAAPEKREEERPYIMGNKPPENSQLSGQYDDAPEVISHASAWQTSQAVKADMRFDETHHSLMGRTLGEEQKKNPPVRFNLISSLKYGACSSTDLHKMVQCNAETVAQDGRLPLHELCDRKFPDRFSQPNVDIISIADDLIDDIMNCRESLDIVTPTNLGACLVQDKEGDLPVHLLTRRLIEWEALWQEKINSLEEIELASDAAKFTRLHKTMGECVDVVLNPIVRNSLACRSRGRLGSRILPIHSAAMFAVPYDTMELLLEAYPESAGVPCDLQGLAAHIPNQSLPLELLERQRSEWLPDCADAKAGVDVTLRNASSDDGVGGIRWSKSTLNRQNQAEDLIRRSDLLLAYYPNILPFRRDTARLERLELMIRASAQRSIEPQEGKANDFDPAARSAWIWMCTFDDPLDDKDTYVANVQRIVDALDIPCVKFLASIDTPHGTVIDTAQPECRQIIQSRLNGVTNDNQTSRKTRPTLQRGGSQNSILKQGSGSASSISSRSNSDIPTESLHRDVFNVLETTLPTSFVILPYQLRKNKDGSLVLHSANCTSVAILYAECLTKMTEPWLVNHILEQKAMICLGHQLSPERTAGFHSTARRRMKLQKSLLNLFKDEGFLYFLDEISGAPIVQDSSDSPPLRVDNPAEAVERLLPLMLMGMIQMRGEKSTLILAETMMEEMRTPPDKWITLSQNLLRYLYSQRNKQRNGDEVAISEELISICDPLADFISRATKQVKKRRPQSEDGCEWSDELSYLKKICDQFAGTIPELSRLSNKKTIIPRTYTVSNLTTLADEKTEINKIQSASAIPPPKHESQKEDETRLSINALKSKGAAAESTTPSNEKTEKNQATSAMPPNRESQNREEVDYVAAEQKDSSTGNANIRRSGEQQNNDDDAICILDSLLSDESRSISSSINRRWGMPRQRATNETSDDERNPYAEISKDQEEKLRAIKERLSKLDHEEKNVLGGRKTTLLCLWKSDSPNDERKAHISDESSSASIQEDDYTTMMMARLSGLEERILEREAEIQQLKLDLCSLEIDSVDTTDESTSYATSDGDDLSFVSSEKHATCLFSRTRCI